MLVGLVSNLWNSIGFFHTCQAAAAAHMAVHCRGKKLVQLHNKSITIASENDFQNDIEEADEIQILSVLKVMADDDASRNIKVLLGCEGKVGLTVFVFARLGSNQLLDHVVRRRRKFPRLDTYRRMVCWDSARVGTPDRLTD